MAPRQTRYRRPAAQFDLVIGSRLRDARLHARLSQQQIATALNLQVSTLEEIECGQVHMKAAQLLQAAELFGRPLLWFFSGATAEAMGPLDAATLQWLAKVYAGLDSVRLRNGLLDLAEELAKKEHATKRPRPSLLN